MKTKFKNILFGIAFILSALIFAEEVNKKVYVVPIQDVIDLGIPGLVSRAIDLAEANNAEIIVFDIDTFGGRVDAATQIKDSISSTEIETIAFINRRAISAGSLISLSCEEEQLVHPLPMYVLVESSIFKYPSSCALPTITAIKLFAAEAQYQYVVSLWPFK